MRRSLNLLDPMGEVISVVGHPVPAAGWYGPNTGLHSVSIRALNFQGRVSVQASLALTPLDTDWFSVLPDEVAYWQYPRLGYIVQTPNTGETSNIGFNFTCNAIWVRATVDRSYFLYPSEAPTMLQYVGVIDCILINY
jgi:hypothetical protein